MEISVLVHQALSIRTIARQMCCSRNTIRRHLKLQAERQPNVCGPRAECVGKLAPFEAFLRQRVDAARPHWIPAIVLLREIREQGWEIAPYLTTRLRCIRPPICIGPDQLFAWDLTRCFEWIPQSMRILLSAIFRSQLGNCTRLPPICFRPDQSCAPYLTCKTCGDMTSRERPKADLT